MQARRHGVAPFSACTDKKCMQVAHADTLLQWSRKLLGSTLTNAVIQRTFFAHFCGGAWVGTSSTCSCRLLRQGLGSAPGCSLAHVYGMAQPACTCCSSGVVDEQSDPMRNDQHAASTARWCSLLVLALTAVDRFGAGLTAGLRAAACMQGWIRSK